MMHASSTLLVHAAAPRRIPHGYVGPGAWGGAVLAAGFLKVSVPLTQALDARQP